MSSRFPFCVPFLLAAPAALLAGCVSTGQARNDRLTTAATDNLREIDFPREDSRRANNIQFVSHFSAQDDAQSSSDAASKSQTANEQSGQTGAEYSSNASNPTVDLALPLRQPLANPTDLPIVSGQTTFALADLEAMALVNNPTIAQMVASTQKAAGHRTQVALRANPFLGYNATQLADMGTDQHTVFISQTIITADKLDLNRRVLNEALRSQLLELEAQKYRVATDVRIKFYEVLATQQQMDLIGDFQSIASKGVELAELRKKAGEGSQLDVVQAKVQQNEIDLALQQAQANFQGAWRELAALIGCPQMSPTALLGELPSSDMGVDWNALAESILRSSPEYQAAEVRVSQARANLQRQCVQPIPNLNVNLGAGVDNGTNSGLINLQVGAPLPVFNYNQGNIAAARAELSRASQDAARIENSIKSRVGAVSSDYNASLAAVNKYAQDILPNAQEGLTLAELAYQAGETSFVQVLVARRTYFDSNLQFLKSQTLLAQSRARVEGFVLTGALDATIDNSGDSSLRDLTFSQE